MKVLQNLENRKKNIKLEEYVFNNHVIWSLENLKKNQFSFEWTFLKFPLMMALLPPDFDCVLLLDE